MLRLILTSLFVTSAWAANADQWRNRTIYQVLTDRFARPDGSEPMCNATARQYCGGTWKGIANKLDYIQDLGFDAVWISPIIENIEGETAYGQAYHAYWGQDMNSLNSHFGTADDLKALSDALHKRGMYFMVDVVANHMASASDPPNYRILQPFSSQSDYHPECFISNYTNQTEVEQCWMGDKSVALVDLNTEDSNVQNTLYTWVNTLVANYSVDGIRIDTVLNIRESFWPGFAQSAGVFTLGEVDHQDVDIVAPYTQALDSVFDYPTWYSLMAAFNQTGGNMSALVDTVHRSQAAYKSGELMVGSFWENHDQPRFQSLTKDQHLVKNAMAWPFVQDGFPVFYQGGEQSFAGGADPENREALWLSSYSEQKPLVTHVKILNAVRRAAIAYNSSFLTTAAKLSVVSRNTIAVSKPPMLALLTNVGSTSLPKWNVSDAGYKPNEELIDVLTCDKISAGDSGAVYVVGTNGDPQILLPAAALTQEGKVCSTMGKGGSAQASSAAPGHAQSVGALVKQAMPIGFAFALAFIASHSSLVFSSV